MEESLHYTNGRGPPDEPAHLILTKPFTNTSVYVFDPSQEDPFWEAMKKFGSFVSAASLSGDHAYCMAIWSLATKKLVLCDEAMTGLIGAPPELLSGYSYETPQIPPIGVPEFAQALIFQSWNEVTLVRDKMLQNLLEVWEGNIAAPSCSGRLLFCHVISAIIRDPQTQVPLEQLTLTAPITPSMFFGRTPLPENLPLFQQAACGSLRLMSLPADRMQYFEERRKYLEHQQRGTNPPRFPLESATLPGANTELQLTPAAQFHFEQPVSIANFSELAKKRKKRKPNSIKNTSHSISDDSNSSSSASSPASSPSASSSSSPSSSVPPSAASSSLVRAEDASSFSGSGPTSPSVCLKSLPPGAASVHMSQNSPQESTVTRLQHGPVLQATWRYKPGGSQPKPWAKNMQKFSATY